MYETAVLIVGAGPTGLTLAVDLARRGIAFRLIEAATTPFEGSRGKGIQPRTLEIFDDLGVIDAILAAGAPYPKFRIHLGPFSLRAGSLSSFQQPAESVPYPNLWMVPQARTEAILRERLRALGGEVEFGKAIAAFTQNQHGVDATLSTGEIVRASFLAGCDGGHSTVRKTLGLRLEGEAIDEKPTLLADVEIEGLDRRDWHLWPFAKGGVIGLCPLPNTSLFQFTSKSISAAADIGDAVHRVTGHQVQRVAWSSIYRPAVRMVDRYRVGRVFLAGDAAHVHPRQAAKDSTQACRTPTTWAGSSHTSLAADPIRCSIPTKPNVSRSPPRYWACPNACTKRDPSSAAMQPTNSPCITERAPCPRASHWEACILAIACPMPGSTTVAGSSIICAVVTRQNLSRPRGLGF